MKLYSLVVNGERAKVWAEKIGSTLWIHHEGKTFTYEPPNKLRRKGGSGSQLASGTIAAPMPGKVTKILAAPGQTVSPGQVLVVMEAMKMEYSLETSVHGTVNEISCREGEQVSLGQILARVEEKA